MTEEIPEAELILDSIHYVNVLIATSNDCWISYFIVL